jgi:hypothetical protein
MGLSGGKLMQETQLKEATVQAPPILSLSDLVSRLENDRDKFLVTAIFCMIDSEAAQRTVEILTEFEPVDYNKVMYGVNVSKIVGLSNEQIRRAFNLNDSEIADIQNYLGLTDNSAQANKGYVAGIRN